LILAKDLHFKNIIFDLDGTLIDSAESILESLRNAFINTDNVPILELDTSLIGPPLVETIIKLLGTNELDKITPVINDFKRYYDEQGFKQSTYFVGIPELLNELKKNGQNLYIATNKRLIPTNKIINYLEWQSYFNEIYTLDTFNPNLKSKTGLISKILELNNFDIADTIYIGDRNEDANAAQFNNLEFMMAKWGYEKLKK
jgi:phosphoglycolate phosphatase